jgi:hypothetical protein
VVISESGSKVNAVVPTGATTGYTEVKTPGGTAESASKFKVLKPLGEATSLFGDGGGEGGGYCALVASGGDCWGSGRAGELGNGAFTAATLPPRWDKGPFIWDSGRGGGI